MVQLTSCVETNTPTFDIYCSITFPKDTFKYDIDIVAGKFEKIIIEEDEVFRISFFAVNGGHSQIGNFKFNIIDGYTSERINIFRDEKLIKRFSYNDLIRFPVTQIDTFKIYAIKL
ncbi:MAG: hypothetical protein IPM42_13475 [Saprospiraceae bacterium]|nr:hypothetical protein [Saprospiraceae bacterium]